MWDQAHVILFTGAFSLSAQLPEAALHFQTALVESVAGAKDAPALTDALMQRAEILGALGFTDKALADIEAAEEALSAVTDAGLRNRSVAELRPSTPGSCCRNPSESMHAATSALAYFEKSSLAARLADVFGTRARRGRHWAIGNACRTTITAPPMRLNRPGLRCVRPKIASRRSTNSAPRIVEWADFWIRHGG